LPEFAPAREAAVHVAVTSMPTKEVIVVSPYDASMMTP
jgi:hypothetical protein